VTETKCPPLATLCQVAETVCPALETHCPPLETRCPPLATQCPVTETKCPPVATLCQATDTVCPATETRCPVLETMCPADPSICPPPDGTASVTSAVLEVASCPALPTRCPSSQAESELSGSATGLGTVSPCDVQATGLMGASSELGLAQASTAGPLVPSGAVDLEGLDRFQGESVARTRLMGADLAELAKARPVSAWESGVQPPRILPVSLAVRDCLRGRSVV